jgi:hypothetical protein
MTGTASATHQQQLLRVNSSTAQVVAQPLGRMMTRDIGDTTAAAATAQVDAQMELAHPLRAPNPRHARAAQA